MSKHWCRRSRKTHFDLGSRTPQKSLSSQNYDHCMFSHNFILLRHDINMECGFPMFHPYEYYEYDIGKSVIFLFEREHGPGTIRDCTLVVKIVWASKIIAVGIISAYLALLQLKWTLGIYECTPNVTTPTVDQEQDRSLFCTAKCQVFISLLYTGCSFYQWSTTSWVYRFADENDLHIFVMVANIANEVW